MMLWVLLALMTGAAVLAVLWPLSRESAEPALDGDVPFYKAQLAEIDRDRGRGLIAAEEAEAARIESGRRLLRAAAMIREAADATSEPALRRRRAASALALCVVPIVGLALYGGLGSPQTEGQPAAARLAAGKPDPAAAAAASGFDQALRRVEEHLAANPGDVRGWDVVAPIYLRLNRFPDAARAYAKAREIGGETAERVLGLAEARFAMNDGVVGDQVRQMFERVVELDPGSAAARFYLALDREQAGDQDGARERYRLLLADAVSDTPWAPLVRARLARLDGTAVTEPAPAGPVATPTLPPSSVTPEIAAMVGGLDERLKAGGGSEAEWSRLVRSLVVLGRRDDALDRLEKAKSALSGDPEAPRRLDRLALDLGLRSGGRTP